MIKQSLFIVSLILVTVFSSVQAQTKKTVLPADAGFLFQVNSPLFPVVTSRGSYTERDYREYTDYRKAGEFKLPELVYLFAIPEGSTVSVSLASSEKRVFPQSVPSVNPAVSAQGDTSYTEYPAQLKPGSYSSLPAVRVGGYTYVGAFYCAEIRYRPVSFNDISRSIEELVSASIKIKINGVSREFVKAPLKPKGEYEQSIAGIIENADYAEPFRTGGRPFQDTTGSWITYSQQYLKMAVAKDGIYRVTKQQLQQSGFALTGVNPANLKMFTRGKELPIYVNAGNDGTFDDGDYLEFYGTMNYNDTMYRVANPDGTPYAEYMNRYTDTSYYFLTAASTQGLRIPDVTTFRTGITDTVKEYYALIHLEKNNLYQPLSLEVVRNQDPEWTETNAWIWSYIGVDPTGNYNQIRFDFETPDVLPGRTARTRMKMISAGTNKSFGAHNVAMYSNDVMLDSQVVDRNKRVVLSGTFSSSTLGTTGFSDIKIRNYPNGGSPNTLAYDWFEVEYPRKVKAIGDSLTFTVTGVTGPRTVLVENVTTSQVVLYRVAPEYKKISGLQFAGGNLVFTDTLSGNATYVLLAQSRILTPVFKRNRNFVNLRNGGRRASYIAITHSSLLAAATPYADYIRTQYGVPVELVNIDDVFDEYSFGYPEPEAIRTFMRSANQLWSGNKPEYLTLLGSACYDYKRLFFSQRGYELNTNLVPSFGEPVSDAWFTIWDDTTVTLIPQMFVGRIPARTPAELTHYLNKLKNHNLSRYDGWNKRALFFSGGDGNDTIQLSQIKSINQFIIDQYCNPGPLSLTTNHFYKTSAPKTDFGPFTPNYVSKSISDGGLFISYIGHSGTRTWDNSIADPNQLLNKVNRGSLVSDFGCSTNKIAEPDVEAFGSLFVNSGQAIAYVGNSSLGFTSTTYTIPQIFYRTLLRDSIRTIGKAHFTGKVKMLQTLGPTGTYRVFALTNLLMGDPIASLGVPIQPNFTLSTGDITLLNTTANDQDDSVHCEVAINNYGTVVNDSLTISITTTHSGNPFYSKTVKIKAPSSRTSFVIAVPVKGKPGDHLLTIKIDPDNALQEQYEDDNTASLRFNVASLAVRNLVQGVLPSVSDSVFVFMNTTRKVQLITDELIVQVSSDPFFTSPVVYRKNLDTFATRVTLTGLAPEKRYWLRARVNQQDTLWSSIATFYKTTINSKFLLKDSLSFSRQQLTGLSALNGVTLANDTISITVKSAPGDRLKFGSILKNGVNILPNTFAWGMGIAVFDPVTYAIDTAVTFWYGDNQAEAIKLKNLLNSIPAGKIVAMNTIDDGAFGMIPELAAAIRTIGSNKIDSLGVRDVWVCIGKKGAAPGTAREILVPRSYPNDILSLDSLVITPQTAGTLLTAEIDNPGNWSSISRNVVVPSGTSLSIAPVLTRGSGTVDTLAAISFSNNTASLASLNNESFTKVKFLGKFATTRFDSLPRLTSLAVNWTGVPELGTNYQSVTAVKDTFRSGEPLVFSFTVFNTGESTAKNVPVTVTLQYPNNRKDTIYSVVIDSLRSGQNKKYTVNYQLPIGEINRTLSVNIDPAGTITELVKDNNSYAFPLKVLPDTTKAGAELLVDKRKAIDGDFVSARPEFIFKIIDPSNLPVGDSTFAVFYLDNKRVFANDPAMTYTFSNANPKLTASFKPVLKDGEHDLRIVAKDAFGALIDSNGVRLNFMVKSKPEIVDAYPYPNPFKGSTRFTFRLTQIPQSLSISIYTVAGRLIKKIEKSASDLQFDFNSVEWDGRDADGSEIANGTYLYRMVLQTVQGAQTTDGKIVRMQ